MLNKLKLNNLVINQLLLKLNKLEQSKQSPNEACLTAPGLRSALA